LNEVKREEYELLEAQSIPLRNYLMKHVMPTLTQGLIDCCKTRPEDPLDYLVCFIFTDVDKNLLDIMKKFLLFFFIPPLKKPIGYNFTILL
jgi:hypothetical protein